MMTLSDVAQPLHVDAFAPGCNSLVIMQETMKVTKYMLGCAACALSTDVQSSA